MSPRSPSRMPDFCSRRNPFHYTTALNTLMKIGIDLSRVSLLAVGHFENYKGEVHCQTPAPGTEITPETRIALEVGSSSGTDYVPFQFFYGIRGEHVAGDDWETRARELLTPFDSSVIRYEAATQYQKRKFNFGVVDRPQLVRFLQLFGSSAETGCENLQELLFWASVMPTFHLWAGNPQAVAAVLERLIMHPVGIIENTRARYDIPESCQSRLGAATGCLGEQFVLGRSFSECDSSYEVVIHGIEPKDVPDYLPGGARRKKLEWVLSVCMPSNLEPRFRIEAKSKAARIGKKRGKCYLGYSTYA